MPTPSAPKTSSCRKVGAIDGGGGHDAAELGDAEQDRDHGDDEDADQDRALDLERVERGDEEEAEDGEQRRRLGHVAEGDEGRLAGDDDAGVLQRDDAEEHADAGGDGAAHRVRDALDQPAADAGDGQDQEDAAGDEDRAERLLPGEAHGADDGEGEEGVEPHARRHGDRPVGVEAP